MGKNDYMDVQGRVREIGRGTWGGPKTTKADYLNVIRWVGNLHGQCALLWAATAMERLDQRRGACRAGGLSNRR